MALRNYSNTAQPVVLTSGIDDTTTTIPVSSTAGYPAVPFTIAIDRKTADEELCLVSAKGASDFTVTRGYGNTTAKAHINGHTVEHVVTAEDYSEPNTHVNATTSKPHGDAYLSDGQVTIRHGGTGSTARPPVTSPVLWLGTVNPTNGVLSDVLIRSDQNKIYRHDGTTWVEIGAGITDHGALGGLGDDDHPQYAKKAGDTYSGPLILDGSRIDRPVLEDFCEIKSDINASGTVNLNAGWATYFRHPLNNTTTYTFTPPTDGGDTRTGAFTLTLIEPATLYSVTWPASVRWPDGAAPTLEANKTYVFTFIYDSDIAGWYGFVAGQGMA